MAQRGLAAQTSKQPQGLSLIRRHVTKLHTAQCLSIRSTAVVLVPSSWSCLCLKTLGNTRMNLLFSETLNHTAYPSAHPSGLFSSPLMYDPPAVPLETRRAAPHIPRRMYFSAFITGLYPDDGSSDRNRLVLLTILTSWSASRGLQ